MKAEKEHDKFNEVPMYVKYSICHVGFYKTSGGKMYIQDYYADLAKKLE
jgi:hypothetical protein